MKWTNKGYEFDRIGSELVKNMTEANKFYIYGAGALGEIIFRSLKGLDSLGGTY